VSDLLNGVVAGSEQILRNLNLAVDPISANADAGLLFEDAVKMTFTHAELLAER
jgi:hypothetical protein